MPLPGWLVEQAHEEWLEEEKSFKEWIVSVEQQYTEEENYIVYKPKNIRPKRYYIKNKNTDKNNK
jgi:hypothetical protein